MQTKKILTTDEKALIRRYLVWCYKTTKEELDRVDRYFTQMLVDDEILASLKKELDGLVEEKGEKFINKVEEFELYMQAKKERVLPQKYTDEQAQTLQPDYWYLQSRLQAIEKSIVIFLNKQELDKIKGSYEEEMTRRIWEAREH